MNIWHTTSIALFAYNINQKCWVLKVLGQNNSIGGTYLIILFALWDEIWEWSLISCHHLCIFQTIAIIVQHYTADHKLWYSSPLYLNLCTYTMYPLQSELVVLVPVLIADFLYLNASILLRLPHSCKLVWWREDVCKHSTHKGGLPLSHSV